MNAIKTTLRCGDTLYVLIAPTPGELEGLVRETSARLLRANGHAVQSTDGSSTWIVDEEIHPTVWHRDGNRVRANRVRCTRDRSGNIQKTTLRQVWVAP